MVHRVICTILVAAKELRNKIVSRVSSALEGRGNGCIQVIINNRPLPLSRFPPHHLDRYDLFPANGIQTVDNGGAEYTCFEVQRQGSDGSNGFLLLLYLFEL